MMQEWTDDIIRFMEDASKNTEYFTNLSSILKPFLNGARNICDAGCGIGQLSQALGKLGFSVVACEKSEKAFEYLRKQSYKNVVPINCDLTTWQPKKPFDAMIFNYFGSMDSILNIYERCCKGPCIVIKRNYKMHRFSFTEKPITGHTNITAEQFLTDRNISFHKQELELEFGQPFKSLDDALLFFDIYSNDTDKTLISKKNILSKLEKTNLPGFKYYLPQTKKSLLFEFNLHK